MTDLQSSHAFVEEFDFQRCLNVRLSILNAIKSQKHEFKKLIKSRSRNTLVTLKLYQIANFRCYKKDTKKMNLTKR